MVTQEIMRWVKEWVAGWTKTRFFSKSDHQLTSRGAASSGYPLILDSTGKIDGSFLDSEDVSDLVGAMVTGNTETGITVTYQDADNTIDFALDDEYLQDTTGAMVTGNTETGISVTYNDGTGKLDFDAQTAGDARYAKLAAANTFTGDVAIDAQLRTVKEATTVASGAITVTRSFATVAGEGGASDDLDTINGGVEGDWLLLRRVSGGTTLTVKDGTGNLRLAGDCVMNATEDMLLLFCIGSSLWAEVARSNNA